MPSYTVLHATRDGEIPLDPKYAGQRIHSRLKRERAPPLYASDGRIIPPMGFYRFLLPPFLEVTGSRPALGKSDGVAKYVSESNVCTQERKVAPARPKFGAAAGDNQSIMGVRTALAGSRSWARNDPAVKAR